MRIRLEFKLADMWVGLFWRRGWPMDGNGLQVDMWICLIPCLPIHVTWRRRMRYLTGLGQESREQTAKEESDQCEKKS